MSEFEILNSMFDSQSITTDEKENTERILEAANLHDNSYQQLWDQIVGEMKMTNDERKDVRRSNVK